jgi:hypothetical protein
VPVASVRHLLGQRLVPLIERGELASPAARFRVMAVSLSVLGEDAPEPVELAMLPEQMLPAQQRRRHVPDPHGTSFQGDDPFSLILAEPRSPGNCLDTSLVPDLLIAVRRTLQTRKQPHLFLDRGDLIADVHFR